VVQRPPRLQPAAIDTYDDHRMAMCFSLASLGGCRVRINDPKCVNKTFPEYFERFAGWRAYLDLQVRLAREHGYVETLFGRRRYIPEINEITLVETFKRKEESE